MDHDMHHTGADSAGHTDHHMPVQPEVHEGDGAPRRSGAGSHDTGGHPDHDRPAGPMHHDGGSGQPHAGTGAHVHDLEDFKKRFIISTILTIPILLLSPVIQSFFGFRFDFPGSLYVTLALASVVYFY